MSNPVLTGFVEFEEIRNPEEKTATINFAEYGLVFSEPPVVMYSIMHIAGLNSPGALDYILSENFDRKSNSLNLTYKPQGSVQSALLKLRLKFIVFESVSVQKVVIAKDTIPGKR